MATEDISAYKITCDRCEQSETHQRKDFKEDKPSNWMTLDMRMNGGEYIIKPSYSAENDLCPECIKELWKWFKKED